MNDRKRTIGRKDAVVGFATSEVRQAADDIEEYVKERESLPADKLAELRSEWLRLGVAMDAAEEMAKDCRLCPHEWQENRVSVSIFSIERTYVCRHCGDEMTEETPREPASDECKTCMGYGHINEGGYPTLDRRDRKCLDCRGSGKR